MKILVLLCGGKRGGNTEKLAEAFIEGFKGKPCIDKAGAIGETALSCAALAADEERPDACSEGAHSEGDTDGQITAAFGMVPEHDQRTAGDLADADDGANEVILLRADDVRPCMGCNHCRSGAGCAIDDDMQKIYEEFLSADCVVFATPLYFWTMSGQMKCVIDRLYALGEDSRSYFSYPKKKCALLATAADTERHFWVFESLDNYYSRLVRFMQWENVGTLMVGSCGGTKQQRRIEETSALDRARVFGASLSHDLLL